MSTKLVFFDIDGTLKPFGRPVPKDTRKAIQRLKTNGHIPVICTGRTRLMMNQTGLVRDLGFPAQICAAGSEVICNDQTIYQRLLDRETLARTVTLLQQLGCGFVLEGPDNLYYQEPWGDAVKSRWGSVMGQGQKMLPYDPATSQVQKLMAMNSPKLSGSKELAELSQHFNVLFYDDGDTAELIPLEASKATGIQRILNHLGMDLQDTYAFGDGPNDLEMLQYVRYGVAMGNAPQAVKDAAPYVTAGCEDGGISLALERFGLIQPD